MEHVGQLAFECRSDQYPVSWLNDNAEIREDWCLGHDCIILIAQEWCAPDADVVSLDWCVGEAGCDRTLLARRTAHSDLRCVVRGSCVPSRQSMPRVHVEHDDSVLESMAAAALIWRR